MEASAGEVTRLLQDWSDGSREALDKFLPLVYDELRRKNSDWRDLLLPGKSSQVSALHIVGTPQPVGVNDRPASSKHRAVAAER